MTNAFSKIALGTLGPAVLRRARISWVGYGVAAYVALRLAKHYGIGGELPDRALGMIDETIRSALGGFGSQRGAAI